VEVKAVSINPVDFKVRNGSLKFLTGSKFPRIFGTDFSGIVKETGRDVKQFKPGDRVYGMTSVFSRKQKGALAQLVAVDQKRVFSMPSDFSFEAAASLPVAALTALNGLRMCRVAKDTDLLINGGTGGVGHFATQIAKARGAKVTVTCSAKNEALARELGADNVMGYDPAALSAVTKKFDVIFDAYGLMKYSDIFRLLRRGGSYATTMPFPRFYFYYLPVRIVFDRKLMVSNLRAKPEDIAEMERLFRDGSLKPVIENYFTLEKAGQAFDLAEHGKPRGKIIVRIAGT
jgi:NADPH:quinone reductase-like Zn-dependent oxidoreductase